MYLSSFLSQEIFETEELALLISTANRREKRLAILWEHPTLKAFLQSQRGLKNLILKLKKEQQEIVLTLMALGQGYALFTGWNKLEDPLFALQHLADSFKPLQKYYRSIGGLIGYQLIVLKLLQKRKLPLISQVISKPEGVHLDRESQIAARFVRHGLESLARLGEVYPIGGAADRMNLHDEMTGEPLPQAKLKFFGKTLLEGLIRDLEARERLFEKLTGEKTLTPIALMTSPEKRNHSHILEILEAANWFKRPKEFFFLFEQPLVPVVSEDGIFASKGPLEPCMKPGGHGIIWQLMHTYGVFDWLQSLKRDKLLVRQINNPLAGLDQNLCALFGKGCLEQKAFGFLSCPRLVGATEGMNVVLSTKNEDGYLSEITNIEYTDFHARGIKDLPEKPDSPFSAYPANTNILFADIKEVKKALRRLPLPGMLINLKNEVTCVLKGGQKITTFGGRLETTMQNIADAMGDFSHKPPQPEEVKHLKTFIVFNGREKTVSVTKKQWEVGQPLNETPQGAWLDLQKNWYLLFTKFLKMSIPQVTDAESPSFSIHLHPALGPLWSVIAQKIQLGELKKGAELHLELAEASIKNLTLDGSLFIESPTLQGKALLHNISIKNKGLNVVQSTFWKGEMDRTESVKIILRGNSEFAAENLVLNGPFIFDVPDGFKMKVIHERGKIKSSLEKLKKPSWQWNYTFNQDDSVLLTFNG